MWCRWVRLNSERVRPESDQGQTPGCPDEKGDSWGRPCERTRDPPRCRSGHRRGASRLRARDMRTGPGGEAILLASGAPGRATGPNEERYKHNRRVASVREWLPVQDATGRATPCPQSLSGGSHGALGVFDSFCQFGDRPRCGWFRPTSGGGRTRPMRQGSSPGGMVARQRRVGARSRGAPTLRCMTFTRLRGRRPGGRQLGCRRRSAAQMRSS